MKLNTNQRQTAHLVGPSPWPMQMSIVLGTLLLGIGIFLMNKTSFGLIGGILILIYWLSEIIKQEVNLVEPTSRLKQMTKVLGILLVFIIIQGILIDNTVYMIGEDLNENNLINTKRKNIEEKIIENIIILIIFLPIGIIIGQIKKLNRITDWIDKNFYKIIFILITIYIILLYIEYMSPILLIGEESKEIIERIKDKPVNINELNNGNVIINSKITDSSVDKIERVAVTGTILSIGVKLAKQMPSPAGKIAAMTTTAVVGTASALALKRNVKKEKIIEIITKPHSRSISGGPGRFQFWRDLLFNSLNSIRNSRPNLMNNISPNTRENVRTFFQGSINFSSLVLWLKYWGEIRERKRIDALKAADRIKLDQLNQNILSSNESILKSQNELLKLKIENNRLLADQNKLLNSHLNTHNQNISSSLPEPSLPESTVLPTESMPSLVSSNNQSPISDLSNHISPIDYINLDNIKKSDISGVIGSLADFVHMVLPWDSFEFFSLLLSVNIISIVYLLIRRFFTKYLHVLLDKILNSNSLSPSSSYLKKLIILFKNISHLDKHRNSMYIIFFLNTILLQSIPQIFSLNIYNEGIETVIENNNSLIEN